MSIKLSHRVGRIQPSPTLAVTALAAQLRREGKDIIGLGAGEPDFDTPDPIKQAAINAIEAGFTKYTAVDGTVTLKQAIIDKFQRDNGLDYGLDEVMVSCGGKQVFYNLCQSLLDPGDEVIIPAPYWVSYPDMVLLADATPVFIEAGIDQGFRITAEQLEAAITPRTRLFVLNTPSNPTSVLYRSEELAALGEVLRHHPEIVIASDDIYEHILLGDTPFNNLLMVNPDLKPRTVVMNGVSKGYSMTGWRIGYAGGPAPLIRAMTKIQSQSTSNPTSISQAAAEAALAGDQAFIEEMNRAFRERNRFITTHLNSIPGIRVLPSEGAFYSFAQIEEAIDRIDGVDNDTEFASMLLNHAGVAVVPGSAFGMAGYIRLSFATSMENLQQAIERMKAILV